MNSVVIFSQNKCVTRQGTAQLQQMSYVHDRLKIQ